MVRINKLDLLIESHRNHASPIELVVVHHLVEDLLILVELHSLVCVRLRLAEDLRR